MSWEAAGPTLDVENEGGAEALVALRRQRSSRRIMLQLQVQVNQDNLDSQRRGAAEDFVLAMFRIDYMDAGVHSIVNANANTGEVLLPGLRPNAKCTRQGNMKV